MKKNNLRVTVDSFLADKLFSNQLFSRPGPVSFFSFFLFVKGVIAYINISVISMVYFDHEYNFCTLIIYSNHIFD